MIARFLLMLVVASSFAASAFAQQPMRKLMSADEARDWQSVGRLNMAGVGFCTGALIAPDLVLTAAHCMFHPVSGRKLTADRIHFLAGWRQGRASAYRKARRIVIHKDYVHGRTAKTDRVASDIAIVELEHPIRNPAMLPFERHERPAVGDEVLVVSYAKDRSEMPSIERSCEVLGKDSRVLVVSCNVDFGASGSPIFVMENGIPKIASVVSAKAMWHGRKVALGTSLGAPLQELLDQLAASNGVFHSRKPGQMSLSEQLGRSTATN